MHYLILISAFCFFSISAHADTVVPERQDKPLFVNTGFNPPISDILEALSREAFARAGKTTRFKIMPAERSLQLVDQGFDDVECCRIPAVVKRDYPELVAVPESIYFVTFSAFMKNPDIKISGWNDLKPYSVGTVKGYKILVNKATEVEPRQLTILDRAYSMMRMLDLGRIDVAILGYEDGLGVMKKLGMDAANVNNHTMIKKPLHIMLNKKHAHLSEALNEAVIQMKADGTIERITEEVLSNY